MNFNFSKDQDVIIKSDFYSNVIVSACAGSGKTTVLIERIKNHSNNLVANHNKKKLLVLTFTNNSKNDIIDRFDNVNIKNINITTFHGFVISEILPFSTLFTHDHRKNGLVLRYTYGIKFENIESWKEHLYKKLEICTANDSLMDFLLNHCFEIMETSNSCKQYLSAKYSTIYIDEAQDNNEVQYKYINLFNLLGIKLFMVGDPNQTIYKFRGAKAELFTSLCNDDTFKSYKLSQNFRCHEYINELASDFKLLKIKKRLDEYRNGYSVIQVASLNFLFEKISNEEEVCYLRYANKDINRLKNKGFKIIKKPEIITEEPNGELIDLILKCYYSPRPNAFELSKFLHYENKNKLLNKITDFFKSASVYTFEELCASFFESTSEILCSSENIPKLVELLKDEYCKNYYTYTKKDKVAMTIHSSKGLEFKTVIIHKSDYYDNNGNIKKNEFYVACTRAKRKLVIIDDINSVYI